MHWSIHSPSPFLCKHSASLLPDWFCPIVSVLVVLQRADCDLVERSPHTDEQEIDEQKDQLRQQFLAFGRAIAVQLRQAGYQADVFDPKTGYPIFSSPGQLWLDDVAVVRNCLGYPSVKVRGCCVIVHPDWGSAVYPSVVVSSAPLEVMAGVARELDWAEGVIGNGESVLERSEYHHSFIGCGSLTQ